MCNNNKFGPSINIYPSLYHKHEFSAKVCFHWHEMLHFFISVSTKYIFSVFWKEGRCHHGKPENKAFKDEANAVYFTKCDLFLLFLMTDPKEVILMPKSHQATYFGLTIYLNIIQVIHKPVLMTSASPKPRSIRRSASRTVSGIK